MQIRVTLASMKAYVRSLDERLIDETKYTDAWVVGKINTGYEIIATRRQPFLNEEVLDLTDYITDGTEIFQADMDYDVLGYKRIFSTTDGSDNALTDAIQWTVSDDQSISIELVTDSLSTTVTNTITFQYWYIPTAPEVETYMSADVYHMLRHGMELSVYETLRDFEKRDQAQAKIESSAKSVINGLDIDVKANDTWDGGFIL